MTLAATVLLVGFIAAADEPVKCVVEQLDKKYAVQFKSMKVEPFPGGDKELRYLTLTLVFTKDVEDKQALKNTFRAHPGLTDVDKYVVPVTLLLFDEDNVLISKHAIDVCDPKQLTGVKEDAFRIKLRTDTTALKKVKKVEARLHPVEKR